MFETKLKTSQTKVIQKNNHAIRDNIKIEALNKIAIVNINPTLIYMNQITH